MSPFHQFLMQINEIGFQSEEQIKKGEKKRLGRGYYKSV